MKVVKSGTLIFICLCIVGCASWHREYKGVHIDSIDKRFDAAYKGTGKKPKRTKYCSIVKYHSLMDLQRVDENGGFLTQSDIDEIWDRCLNEIAVAEAWGVSAREEAVKKRLAEKKARALKKKKDKEERLREYGVDFYDLYARAVHEGAKKYNAIISRYDKIDLRSIYIKNCSGAMCTAGYQSFSGAGTSGPPDILIRGIYAEPGTPLSVYKFVRFEDYGRVPSRSVVAIFVSR